MNLKSSFAYSNYLQNLKKEIINRYLNLSGRHGNSYTDSLNLLYDRKATYQRSKVINSAEDEVITEDKPLDYSADQVVELVNIILAELEALYDAIAKAKKTADFNIDYAVSSNKEKQEYLRVLEYLASLEDREYNSQASAYAINNDGNQNIIRYYVEITEEVDFDKNNIKEIIIKTKKEIDANSEKVESVLLNTRVDFEPKFDVYDNIEDALEICFG